MFWPLYVFNEQQGKTVHEVWDGQNLMLTFRRSVSSRLMNLWFELTSIIESVSLTEEDDHIMWSYTSSGKYSVQSLYAVINHRGVVPMFVSAVWKLNIPQECRFFCGCWLTIDSLLGITWPREEQLMILPACFAQTMNPLLIYFLRAS
jgi:hypothetical protein